MRIIGCLQNVWFYPHVPEERCRDYDFWYKAFCRARSGERLIRNLGRELFSSFEWENASPQIGRESGAKFPADLQHINKWIAVRKPDLIVAFGQVAEKAPCSTDIRDKYQDLICVPHPASRLVTNDLFLSLRDILYGQIEKRNGRLHVALRQKRGAVTTESLL
jgi:hypothetical protein